MSISYKLFTIIALLSSLISPICSQTSPIKLNPEQTWGDDHDPNDIYFKSLPIIASSDHHLYMAKNIENTIYKVNLHDNSVTLLGTKGQGPGEYYLPISLSISQNIVSVMDNNTVSFFNDHNGKYLDRFRLFGSHGVFHFFSGQNVFLFDQRSNSPITIRDTKGKKIIAFGELYPPPEELKNSKDRQYAHQIFSILNDAIILWDGEKVIQINRFLSKINTYSKKGEKLDSFFLSFQEGKVDSTTSEKSNLQLIYQAVEKEKPPQIPEIIESAYVHEKNLFVTFVERNEEYRHTLPYGKLAIFSIDDFNLINQYFFHHDNKNTRFISYRGLTVRKDQSRSLFIPVVDDKKNMLVARYTY